MQFTGKDLYMSKRKNKYLRVYKLIFNNFPKLFACPNMSNPNLNNIVYSHVSLFSRAQLKPNLSHPCIALHASRKILSSVFLPFISFKPINKYHCSLQIVEQYAQIETIS